MAQTAQININLNSKQAQGEIDKLSGSINSAGGSAASLRLELRKTVQELQNLEPGSARFRELSLRAGELRDQIADTNAVVGQLAGNVAERLTRGITGVVSVGVAGFQTIAASAALFGAESEELTQTLVKLNALMNLSQAIETFAGLDQKIVEIRAAFQSLTTSTVAQAVATEGQAVANVAATTTTTALGVAMKALPIIAIVAGLGTLVYGLYQYATANSEATQKEKEAAKQREILEKRTKALEKAQDEDRKQVAASSVEYFNLIQRLKETNAGSKERDKLIKQINTEYGTTLKNLKDETAFQSQLNLSVKEYIALQVLKVKQESNKKNEEKAINNLVKAQSNLNKFQKEYAGMTEKEISDYDIRNYGVSVYRDTLIKLTGELDNAQKRAENYAITNGKLQKEIDKLQVDFPDLTNKTKDNTNSTKDATDATDKYAEALEKIKEIIDRQAAAEEGLQDIKNERLSRTSAQVSEEIGRASCRERVLR
jgi:DNA repair exonuclease SbcCD ATPase subunit